MRCPKASADPALARKVPDIDLITRKKDVKLLKELMTEIGVQPVSMFNALHGDRRLLFTDPKLGRQIDVFIELFEMCHKFDFMRRLLLDESTLTLADLLLTKLQIVEINEKDYKDILCLFLDHPMSEKDDRESINAAYIAAICSEDWGIWKTITRNLGWVRDYAQKMQIDDSSRATLLSRLDVLLERIEEEPKSLRWKMRSKVGERVMWYDTPDRVGKITTDQ